MFISEIMSFDRIYYMLYSYSSTHTQRDKYLKSMRQRWCQTAAVATTRTSPPAAVEASAIKTWKRNQNIFDQHFFLCSSREHESKCVRRTILLCLFLTQRQQQCWRRWWRYWKWLTESHTQQERKKNRSTWTFREHTDCGPNKFEFLWFFNLLKIHVVGKYVFDN